MAWLTNNMSDNLLGNARPKSYAKCRDDSWWYGVFMAWWNEGAAGKPMYKSVGSLYDDLIDYYNGQMTADTLYQQWVTDPPDVTLIDAGARRAFQEAYTAGDGVDAAVGRLWEVTAAQMEMVYGVFYDDVGRVKEVLRREGVERAIEEAFPGL